MASLHGNDGNPALGHAPARTGLSWDTVGARGGAFALCPPGWQGVLPEGVQRIDMGTPLGWTLPRLAVNGEADLPAAADAHRIIAERMPRAVPIVNNWQIARLARADAQEPTRHETRSGLLEFEANGYPTDQTVEHLREEIDYQRAVQAYIHFVPAVGLMQWRNGHFDRLGGKFLIVLDGTKVPENHGADFVVTSKTSTVLIGTRILTPDPEEGQHILFMESPLDQMAKTHMETDARFRGQGPRGLGGGDPMAGRGCPTGDEVEARSPSNKFGSRTSPPPARAGGSGPWPGSSPRDWDGGPDEGRSWTRHGAGTWFVG